jgi:fatty-acyl-CoA synthase
MGDNDPLRAGIFMPQLLAHALSRDRQRPAIYLDDGRVLSAGDLSDLASSYLQALTSVGVRQNTRVAILSRNRPEVVYAMNALTLADACMTPLHPMGAVDDFAYCIQDARIECLIFDPGYFQDMAAELQRRLPVLKHLLALGPTSVGVDLTALAATMHPAGLDASDTDPSRISRIIYSGGTTGLPKGIMLSQQANLTMSIIVLTEWEWPREIRHLVCSPLSHAAQAILLPVLMRDGALIVLPGFDPVAVLTAIERYRITSTLMVPTMIYALLDHPRLREFDLSSLETVFYGSASISPQRLRDAIAQFGPIFFQFYGQTEAPLSATVLRRHEHTPNDLQRLTSCGRPVPWVHVALLGSDDAEVAQGEPGEICLRGPLVAAGYLNKPDQTAATFANGWLHTGDIAIRDEGGYLRIVDRKKDMIITGGFNVYPREIEDVIAAHPSVAMVAVIGVADEKWGEAVKAIVVLRDGMAVDTHSLVALVRDRKGPIQAPKSIDFVSSLPLTPLGKIDKKALRQSYQQPGSG